MHMNILIFLKTNRIKWIDGHHRIVQFTQKHCASSNLFLHKNCNSYNKIMFRWIYVEVLNSFGSSDGVCYSSPPSAWWAIKWPIKSRNKQRLQLKYSMKLIITWFFDTHTKCQIFTVHMHNEEFFVLNQKYEHFCSS